MVSFDSTPMLWLEDLLYIVQDSLLLQVVPEVMELCEITDMMIRDEGMHGGTHFTSFPGLPTVQLLIAYSKTGRKSRRVPCYASHLLGRA